MSSAKDTTRTVRGAASATPSRIEGVQPDGVDYLTLEECWRLLRGAAFGRLAVIGRDGMPDIYPLNYTVHDGSFYVRSAPGAKLRAIALHPAAALEIDGEDGGYRWSVVVRGAARRLASDHEIHESGIQHLISSSPTANKYNYVCVTPTAVSGRRFFDRSAAFPAASRSAIAKPPIGNQEPTRPVDDTVMRWRRELPGSLRPIRIAHLPPR